MNKRPKNKPPAQFWIVMSDLEEPWEPEGPFVRKAHAVSWRNTRRRDGYPSSVAGPYVLKNAEPK